MSTDMLFLSIVFFLGLVCICVGIALIIDEFLDCIENLSRSIRNQKSEEETTYQTTHKLSREAQRMMGLHESTLASEAAILRRMQEVGIQEAPYSEASAQNSEPEEVIIEEVVDPEPKKRTRRRKTTVTNNPEEPAE